MQLAWLVGGVGALLATAALAAPGDDLLVAGNNVNVRAGPSTEAGILTRVGRDAPAIERRRQGRWVEIDLPVQDVRGWIHDSLLSAAPIEPAAGPRGDEAGAPPDVTPAVAPEVGPDVTPDVTPDVAPDVAHVAATDPAAVEAAQDRGPLGTFRKEVEYFNNRAVAAAGVDLFTGVAPLGEGGVQVVTTEAWATMSAPGQQSYVNALFGRWQAVAGDEQPLRLQIVDSNGAVMMEKTAP